MSAEIDFYRVAAPKVYFNPSGALASGYKTLVFVEMSPHHVLSIAEKAFGLEISKLRDADPIVCDVWPKGAGPGGNISELKQISAQSFYRKVDDGFYSTAVFEQDALFIAVFGSDATWVVHARLHCSEIFDQFSDLLAMSKSNAEVLGKSAILAPYFAGAV